MNDHVQLAMERAVSFVTAKQATTGEFADFLAFRTPGTEWVTAFVGRELLGYDNGSRNGPVARAAAYVRRVERPLGGWGYHAKAPVDADSIACCARFLGAVGGPGQGVSEASLDVLRRHYDPASQGFRSHLPWVAGLPAGSGFAEPSPCVTANAALALAATGKDTDTIAGVVANVLAEQTPSGAWTSYWWADFTYPTYFCTLLLHSQARGGSAVARALDWLRRTRVAGEGWNGGTQGSSRPFSTALALKAMCLCRDSRDEPDLDEAVQWLLREQGSDGSWTNPPVLRVPEFAVTARWSPGDDQPVLEAQERVFTTALAIGGLSDYLRRRQGF
jgi:hypothetical protein